MAWDVDVWQTATNDSFSEWEAITSDVSEVSTDIGDLLGVFLPLIIMAIVIITIVFGAYWFIAKR